MCAHTATRHHTAASCLLLTAAPHLFLTTAPHLLLTTVPHPLLAAAPHLLLTRHHTGGRHRLPQSFLCHRLPQPLLLPSPRPFTACGAATTATTGSNHSAAVSTSCAREGTTQRRFRFPLLVARSTVSAESHTATDNYLYFAYMWSSLGGCVSKAWPMQRLASSARFPM